MKYKKGDKVRMIRYEGFPSERDIYLRADKLELGEEYIINRIGDKNFQFEGKLYSHPQSSFELVNQQEMYPIY